MPMTSLSAQEEGRAFVEAAEVTTQDFYHPEPEQLMPLPKPIQTPVFRAAQLYGTYFKCEDENESVTRVSQLDVFQHLPDSSLGTNDNSSRGATKKLFPSLSKGMVMRSNKLDKGHICLKWHSATKVRSAQELGSDSKSTPIPFIPKKIEEADLLNTLGWLVAPVHHCLGCYNTKCKFRLWIHRAYNMSKEREFTAQHKLPPKYKDDNCFKQDWFMGIYMQLLTNHCPEWVDVEPTCAMNFDFMGFPIVARDTEDMEASANYLFLSCN
eukprot:jgi/Psemu1/37178/gm1.37178_g